MPEAMNVQGESVDRASWEGWLEEQGFALESVRQLQGDVSPRRYARLALAGGGSAIFATYPPEVRATCPRFLHTSELLEGAGVRVPRILAADCGQGWMLLEDLGPVTLGDWKGRPWSEIMPFFERALELAGRIARLPAEAVGDLNPVLGRELMERELKQTWDLFLEPRGLTGDSSRTAALGAALDEICSRLADDPPVPCHRDYMARNLMPLPGGHVEVAVLDHQDLRLGPPAYDLASLLNDTLFPPAEEEEALLGRVLATPEERESYHRAAAQRTLKAVGTYSAFALRGAERHLPLIAPTLGRFLEHLARIPEGERLAAELRRDWAAEVEQEER